MKQRGFSIDLPTNIREYRDEGLTTIRFGEVLVDLMRPVIPAYARVLDHAVDAQILGQTTRISSIEGLIVMKLIAMRPQDEMDVQELLRAHRDQINLDQVRAELADIYPADEPRLVKFEQWVLEIS